MKAILPLWRDVIRVTRSTENVRANGEILTIYSILRVYDVYAPRYYSRLPTFIQQVCEYGKDGRGMVVQRRKTSRVRA